MNLYCDRYSVCNSWQLDQGDQHATEERARAKGWHLYKGTDQAGRPHEAILCAACVDSKRRKLDPPPQLLTGQREIWELMVYCPPGS